MSATRPRTMWNDILPAWDAAHHAARTATNAERSVLGAVLWLLARHQRTTDTVRLAQVAYEAGMWHGDGPPTRSIIRHVGLHLQALADLGAITYEPSKSRRGCLIGLPTTTTDTRAASARDNDAGRAPQQRDTDTGSRSSGARHNGTSRAPGRPTRAPQGHDTPSARALPRPARAPQARASEGFPEDEVRGDTRGRAAHAGSVTSAGDARAPGGGDAAPSWRDIDPDDPALDGLTVDQILDLMENHNQ